jgi:hypothetical protein
MIGSGTPKNIKRIDRMDDLSTRVGVVFLLGWFRPLRSNVNVEMATRFLGATAPGG